MTVQVVADEFPEPQSFDAGPYALMVTLQARPERADDLERLLVAQVAPTRAEPGCLYYYLTRNRLKPSDFYFFEAYASLDAFRSHLATPRISEMLAVLPDYLQRDNDMTFLEVVSPPD